MFLNSYLSALCTPHFAGLYSDFGSTERIQSRATMHFVIYFDIKAAVHVRKNNCLKSKGYFFFPIFFRHMTYYNVK